MILKQNFMKKMEEELGWGWGGFVNGSVNDNLKDLSIKNMMNIFFCLCGFHCKISSRLVTLKKIGTGFIRNLECHFLRMFLICLFWFSSRSFAFLTLGSIRPSCTFCRSTSSPSPKAKPFKFVKPSDIWPKINNKWQNSLFNYNENQSLLIKNWYILL